MKYPILKIEQKLHASISDFSFIDDIFIYSSEGLFGFISNGFTMIIPPLYEEIIPAFSQHFWGRKDQKWKLYNFENIEVNDVEFKVVATFQNGYCCISQNGKTFGFINRDGNVQIPAHYLNGKHLGNSFFAIGKNIRGKVKYEIIDKNENLILPFSFNEIPTFTEVILFLLKRRKPLREWLKL